VCRYTSRSASAVGGDGDAAHDGEVDRLELVEGHEPPVAAGALDRRRSPLVGASALDGAGETLLANFLVARHRFSVPA